MSPSGYPPTTESLEAAHVTLADLVHALLRDDPDQDIQVAIDHVAASTRLSEETLHLVRRLGNELDRLRMRARNLEILYDTAGDLSALQDLEDVLLAIVRRGRSILGTDVAYLMLIDDERGDAYMRVSEGAIGKEFHEIRLSLGAGLGGVVAQTARPLWTADYLADPRFVHAVDNEVEDDALVAILGVPLLLGPRVIGVLFAADRHSRTFSHDEVSLLGSLAAHAAIAIRAASLLEETRRSLAELTTAKLMVEARNESLRRTSEMHERLTRLLLAGANEVDIASAVVEVIDGTLLVLSPSSRLLARAGRPAGVTDIDDPEPNSVLGGADRLRLLESLPADAHLRGSWTGRVHGLPCRFVPIAAGTTHLGWLLFFGPQLDEIDTRSLENAATVTALLWLIQRANDEAENRLRHEILAEILSGRLTEPESAYRRAEMLGADLRGALTVMTVLPGDRQPRTYMERILLAHAKEHGGLVARMTDRFVLAFPGTESSATTESLLTRLRRADPPMSSFTVGVERSGTGLLSLPEAENRSHRSAKVLRALDKFGCAAGSDELGVFGLLLSDSSQDEIGWFVSRALGSLEDYDERRGSELVHTLETYFNHDGVVSAASDALFVHVNTLYNRLDRIDRILGTDWRSGERALSLRIALKLRRLIEN